MLKTQPNRLRITYMYTGKKSQEIFSHENLVRDVAGTQVNGANFGKHALHASPARRMVPEKPDWLVWISCLRRTCNIGKVNEPNHALEEHCWGCH